MTGALSGKSKSFFDFVRAIGESKSKQEEDRIIQNAIESIKNNLSESHISLKKKKELLISATYVEMMGHDASFAYIHAVNMTHDKNIVIKRVGYLFCTLFLHRDHELMLLLVNTIQGDLSSSKYLEVSVALNCIIRLINVEMIPAYYPLIKKLLAHPRNCVRKKACMAMRKMRLLDPHATEDPTPWIKSALCDSNPSVISASLIAIEDCTKVDLANAKQFTAMLVSILHRISEHRLSKDYDYHRVPVPWMQIKILSLLASVGKNDALVSKELYEILSIILKKADIALNVGHAIVYECVKAIATIYPLRKLLEDAVSTISRFASSPVHNLKYVGITGLEAVVQVDPSYVANLQLVVVDCLEDPDETLKRRTLNLLFNMTNPANVEVVLEKLIKHLKETNDQHIKKDLATKVALLAERYAPNYKWYLDTINTVMELAGKLLPQATCSALINLLSEGPHETEKEDMELREYAVNSYVKYFENFQGLPDCLIQIMSWVLGEYGMLCSIPDYCIQDTIDLLCEAAEGIFENKETRSWILNGAARLCAQTNNQNITSLQNIFKKFKHSQNTDLQQQAYELELILQSDSLIREVLPYDASSEDILVDENLSFLNNFVSKNANKKIMKNQTITVKRELPIPELTKQSRINFTPYAAPSPPIAKQTTSVSEVERSSDKEQPTSTGLQVKGPRKWGPSGYNGCVPNDEVPTIPQTKFERQSSPQKRAVTPPKNIKVLEINPILSEREKMAAALFSGVTSSTKMDSANNKESHSGNLCKLSNTIALHQTKSVSESETLSSTSSRTECKSNLNTLDILNFDECASNENENLNDISLEPLHLTTAEVATKWSSLKGEAHAACEIASKIDCIELMHEIRDSFDVHVVEIIGDEGIASCQTSGKPIFVHVKCRGNVIDFIVKASDTKTCETLLSCLSALVT